MRLRWMMPAILALACVASAAGAQDERARRRAPSPALLTVETGVPASCRVVDSEGASRTKEFGAPATIALGSRRPGDLVVCVRDGRERRVALPATGRRVGVAMDGVTAAAAPVRRLVTPGEVHPYPGHMRLSPKAEQDLVWLRQRYEEGVIAERDYFAFRRDVIARGASPAARASAPPSRQPARRTAPPG